MATKRKSKTKAEKAKSKVKFQQKRNQQVNLQQAYYKQIMDKQDMMRRAMIVEGIHNARPELATEVDGKLVLNEDAVYFNEEDKTLYWKADNNPICSGLEEFGNYSSYSPEFINEVLEFISIHKAKQQNVADVDMGDFELVEDDNFTEIQEDNTEDNIIINPEV